jgi:hypothetical protein
VSVRRVDGPDDPWNAAGLLECRDEPLAVGALDAGRPSVAESLGQRRRGRFDIRVESGDGGRASGDSIGQKAAERVEPLTRPRRDDQNRHFWKSVSCEEPGNVLTPVRDLFQGKEIGLVQHDRHRRTVRLQRAEIAFVQRRVGVLLWLDHPDDQVGERHDSFDLEPVGGLDGIEVG